MINKTKNKKQKKRENIMTTLTHIACPSDTRCKWFQAELKKSLTATDLEGTKFDYFKKNDDLELEIGTLLLDFEEISHNKHRGARVMLGLATDEKVIWIKPNIEMKKLIKSEGHKDLMVGSGLINASVRVAIYLRRQENILEAFLKLKELC